MANTVETILRLTGQDNTARALDSAKRRFSKFRKDEVSEWQKFKVTAATTIGAAIGGDFLRRAFTNWAEMDRKVRVLTYSLEGTEKQVGKVKRAIQDLASSGVATQGQLIESADVLDDILNLNEKAVGSLNKRVAEAARMLGTQPRAFAEAFANSAQSFKITEQDYERAVADIVVAIQNGNISIEEFTGRFPLMAEQAAKAGYKGERGFRQFLSIFSTIKQEANISTKQLMTGSQKLFDAMSTDAGKLEEKLKLSQGSIARYIADAVKKGEDPLTAFADMIERRTKALGMTVEEALGDDLSTAVVGAIDRLAKSGRLDEAYKKLGEAPKKFAEENKAFAADAQTQVDALTAQWVLLTEEVGRVIAQVNNLGGLLGDGSEEKVTFLTIAATRLGDIGRALDLINAGIDALVDRFPSLGRLPTILPGPLGLLSPKPLVPTPEQLQKGGEAAPDRPFLYTPDSLLGRWLDKGAPPNDAEKDTSSGVKKMSYTSAATLAEMRKQTSLLQRIGYGGGMGGGGMGGEGGGLQYAAYHPGGSMPGGGGGGGRYGGGYQPGIGGYGGGGYGGGGLGEGGGGAGLGGAEGFEPVRPSTGGGATGPSGSGTDPLRDIAPGGGVRAREVPGGGAVPSVGGGGAATVVGPDGTLRSVGPDGTLRPVGPGGGTLPSVGGPGGGVSAVGPGGARRGIIPPGGLPAIQPGTLRDVGPGGAMRGGGPGGALRGGGPGGALRDIGPQGTPRGVGPGAAVGAGGGAATAIPQGGFSAKAPAIMQRLMNRYGLTSDQAAGILGNLGHESGGFKHFQEIGSGPTTGGRGWAQWTGTRRVKFLKWANEQGLDPRTDEASMGFLEHELDESLQNRGDASTRGVGAIPAVRGQTTAEGSMKAFEHTFERAGKKNWKSRRSFTSQAQRAYAASPKTAPAPGEPQAVPGQPEPVYPEGAPTANPKPITQEVELKYKRGPKMQQFQRQDLRREVNRETRQARFLSHSDIGAA